MTEDSANQTILGHDVFVSYASQDAADHAATALHVLTRSHVPGRRKPVRGACGKNFLFFTPRPMTSRDYIEEVLTRSTCFPRNARTPFEITWCSR
jgi:hypothetical protein